MTGPSPGARGRWLTAAGAAVAVLFLAKAVYRGLTFTRGDFYFTLPGEYAARWNPVLWQSPDLQLALQYNHGGYIYGPVQYLALFPIVFLDSYASIATALLVAYPVVALGAAVLLWRLVRRDEGRDPVALAGVMAVVFAFLPLTQALVQREFEVVTLLMLAATCLLFARGRYAASGAVLACMTWFKYWPMLLLIPFVVHRRFRGVAAFVGMSAAILLATQLVFGLQHFVIPKTVGIVGGLVRPLGGGEVLYPVIPRGAAKSDFCRQWIPGRGTQADARWALCGIQDRFPAVPAKAVFIGVVALTAALFFWSAVGLDRRWADPAVARWASIWEFSVLAIGGAAFLHAHFYYFVVFLLPLTALLCRYATRPGPWRRAELGAWVATYLLLNAFLVPPSLASGVLGVDAWALYLDSGLPFLGTLLLLGLVLRELTRLAGAPRPSAVAA
ncbi:MAG: glycosyltransferase family 87 protein [Vicinamibacterales bacterium]